MLDVGTANAIELRRTSTRVETAPAIKLQRHSSRRTPPQGAMTPNPGMVQPNQPGNNQAGNQMPGGPGGRNGGPVFDPLRFRRPRAGPGGSFLFDPPAMNQAKGATFTVNVMLSGGQNIYSVPVQLNYDPNQLQVVNVSNGGFLSQDGQAVALVHRDDPATGNVAGHGDAASGSGRRFRPGRSGDADIHGEGAGPVGVDHHTGRRTRSGDAADPHEWGAGGDHDSVGAVRVLVDEPSELALSTIRRQGARQRGFTLIELIVATTILVILVGMARAHGRDRVQEGARAKNCAKISG